MSSYNQRECVGCGQPCDGFYCYLCTCQQCGVNLINGICLNCTYGDGKPVTCCGCEGPLNGGFCSFCASRAGNSFAYDPNPNFFDDSQNLSYHPTHYQPILCEFCGNDARYGHYCTPQVPIISNPEPCYNQNYDEFPQTLPSFQQQILCCENCGGLHATFECQPMNQNFHDSNSSGFDQFQPPQFPVIHQPPQEMRMEALQAREDLMKSIQNFLKKFNRISFRETPKVLIQACDKFFEVKHAQPEDVQELLNKLLQDLQSINEELADFINTLNWNRPAFCNNDDDDEEYTIAITPVLPTEKPDNSLSMGDEHLDTIPATESDEVIKYSFESLVPIPSESEDFFNIESECDVPDCDDSLTTICSTFSNPLFEDSTSSDNKSSHEEGDILFLESLLYDNSSPRPPEAFQDNSNTIIESLPTFPILVKDSDSLREEIDIFPDPDDSIPPAIESDDFDSEGDNNSTSLPEFESFHVDYPDSGYSTIDVVEDIPVDVPNILPTHPALQLGFDFIPSH
ncbi:hypothetical protein Tco_1061269, partial [Tanacetum coccineum]